VFESRSLSLNVKDRDLRGEVQDVSPAGVKINLPEPLHAGATARMALDGLGVRRATACWTVDGQAGFAFTPPLSYSEFAKWRRLGKSLI
jgi:hypothetical protein